MIWRSPHEKTLYILSVEGVQTHQHQKLLYFLVAEGQINSQENGEGEDHQQYNFLPRVLDFLTNVLQAEVNPPQTRQERKEKCESCNCNIFHWIVRMALFSQEIVPSANFPPQIS